MAKVFITRSIPDVGIQMLKAKGYEVMVGGSMPDAEAILSQVGDAITPEFLKGFPNVKIIANYAVGFDNIDLPTAKSRNIFVTNTPNVLNEAVAEHAMALILAIARRIPESDRFVRAGKYTGWKADLLVGTELAGKTLGIVGLGRIGFQVAHHAANGFGMKIAYTDPKENPEFNAEHHAQYFPTIDELLPQCDFVTLHVPLLDSTRHLMNAERFKKMKPTAYLINTARGPVVDEAALIVALKDHVIRGAGIDVFEHEPEINPELFTLENVVLTPHTASGTEEARNKMAVVAATNIIETLEGRTPPNLVS